MKKNMKFAHLLVLLFLVGCTSNQRAKSFGGTSTEKLPPGQKLVNISWKDGAELWILTKPMKADDIAETYTFDQSSSWGFVEGTIIVVESR